MRAAEAFGDVPVVGDVASICAAHSSCRTRARASLNVGSGLGYQRTLSSSGPRSTASWLAHRVTSENSARSAGVVRRMARSDHCLWLEAVLPTHPEVPTSLFEGGLHPPSANKPAQDVDRRGLRVGAEEGLRLLLATWVAHQHPADRHPCAAVRPECGAGGDIEAAGAVAIPAINSNPAPTRAPVAQALGQAGLPRPLHWRPTSPPGPTEGGGGGQAGLQGPAGGDQ